MHPALWAPLLVWRLVRGVLLRLSPAKCRKWQIVNASSRNSWRSVGKNCKVVLRLVGGAIIADIWSIGRGSAPNVVTVGDRERA